MAVQINVTTKQPETQKEVTKTLTNVNPNATDAQAASFVTALGTLSKNSITNVEKVTKSNIELPTA